MSKKNIDLMLQIRNSWTINPSTRVHDNNSKKNKKKSRQQGKKIAREYDKAETNKFQPYHIY